MKSHMCSRTDHETVTGRRVVGVLLTKLYIGRVVIRSSVRPTNSQKVSLHNCKANKKKKRDFFFLVADTVLYILCWLVCSLVIDISDCSVLSV